MGYLPIKPFLYVQKAPTIFMTLTHGTLQWRHNERDGISHQWRLDCLLNRLFRHRSKKASKLCITGLCEGFVPSLNKLLDKQSSCQWFETSWSTCDVAVMWLDLMQCASGIRLFLFLAYRLSFFTLKYYQWHLAISGKEAKLQTIPQFIINSCSYTNMILAIQISHRLSGYVIFVALFPT